MYKLKVTKQLETVYGFDVPSVYIETNQYYTEQEIQVSMNIWISKEVKDEGAQQIQLKNFSNYVSLNKQLGVCDGSIYQSEQKVIKDELEKHLLNYGVTTTQIEYV